MNFKQWLIKEENYSEFQQWLVQNKIDAKSLVHNISQNPPDHRGGNANFWYIPNSPFGLRIIRTNQSPIEELQPHDNPLSDMNVGQAIANLGPKIQILRLQKGSPAGVKFGTHKLTPEEQQKEFKTYAQKVIDAANIDQKEYNKLLYEIIKLNKKGYNIDPSKPGNLLIDPGKGFNLVDVIKSNGRPDNAGYIIVMLMNNYYFNKISSPEIQQAARTIIKKVEIASQLTGLPLEKDQPSARYSYELAGL
jgi:hypothetical protein